MNHTEVIEAYERFNEKLNKFGFALVIDKDYFKVVDNENKEALIKSLYNLNQSFINEMLAFIKGLEKSKKK